MYLFEQEYTSHFFGRQKEDLKDEIMNLSDDQILTIKLTELEEYYLSKYTIEPISLCMDKIISSLDKSTMSVPNPFYSFGYNEPESYETNSYKISYTIPFYGNPFLLRLIPSHSIWAKFPVDNLLNTENKTYTPSIAFSININSKELEEKENPQAFINQQFDSEFKNYQSMIDYINDEVKDYNNSLSSYIKTLLEIRKNKADSFSNLMSKLTIPLKKNPYAPPLNLIPLSLKKTVKQFPSQSTQEEWYVSEEDYSNIKKIISQACSSYEHTAITIKELSEEDIRNLLLSNLNTHYDSSASGETFSKKGKTDIRIQFENKSAYIAECKIWHGIKGFEKAINQLFSYITWRDIKTSLIVFNKDIRDFSKVLEKIKQFLDENELKISCSPISKNEWQYTFKKSLDSDETILLHVIICDIYV